MMRHLDFERPIVDIEKKIHELKGLSKHGSLNLQKEIQKLEAKLDQVKKFTYGRLTPWQRVQLARHPKRPYTLDYVRMIFSDFMELHGDRVFADDKALVGGVGCLNGRKYMIVGHQKGRDAKENVFRNFGSAHPEGYRKAIRLMKLAEKFRLPVISFIDTPGAYPGIGAEERGQAYTIAYNLREMIQIEVPIVVFVIGEGGSGGALGIGIGDRICMLENAYYSVISPEGCAAILWRDPTKAQDAADSLKLIAEDLLKLGMIDCVVKEPLGGAHFDPAFTAREIQKTVEKYMQELRHKSGASLVHERYEKFRKMGVFEVVKEQEPLPGPGRNA